MSKLRVVPLEKTCEEQFLNLLNKDRILHIFTIYDLKYQRDKTEVWMAFENDETVGYLMEFARG